MSHMALRAAALAAGIALGAILLALVPDEALFRAPPHEAHETAAAQDGRRWACPMFCTMADAPGLCPVCGMEMEPVADTGDRVPLDAHARTMIELRTAPVARRLVTHDVSAFGRIRRDERSEGQITAWVDGRLDRLYVDFTGTRVREGDHVAEIYAPELIAAQEELLSALRAVDRVGTDEGPAMEGLRRSLESGVQAARRKLVLLGMPADVVAAVEDSREVRDHLTIYAPVGGTVVEKRVETGDYVKTGQPMFTVADLSVVWVQLEVYEEDVGAVRIGHDVTVTVPSLPGRTFHGKVAFVDPFVDEHLRVAHVRVNLPNPGGVLRPGGFVDAVLHIPLTSAGRAHDPIGPGMWVCPMHPSEIRASPGACSICGMDLVQKEVDAEATEPGPVLVVPREAVLHGGRHEVVYVQVQEPGPVVDGLERWPAVFERREVVTGFETNGDVVVLEGLEEGDRVAVRGQMLIDSQLQLTGRPSLLAPAGAPGIDPHAGHEGH